MARGKVEFINCTFQRANYGAVRTAYTECSFTGCIFSNNLGKYYGGHINASIKSNIIVDNCTFSYGTSSSRGGAIHIDDADSSIHIKDSKISANESGLGGGISCSGALILEDTVIYNNHASTGGADLFIIGSYQIPSIEEMKEAYHAEGLEPVSWESDYTDVDYGGTCLKLSYEAYTAPTDPTPTEPETSPSDGDEEKEPSTGDNTGDTEPDSPQEPEDTEPITPSTPSGAENTGGATVDNSSNSTTDNSQTNIDNSQSTSSTDNSSHESNDNSSYREDNSYRDSSSTVNNYYQQENPIQEPTASQNGSQPINITVPVEVSNSQEKEALTSSTQRLQRGKQ